MGIIYNIGILLLFAGIKLVSPFNRKARLWVRGRKKVFKDLHEVFQNIRAESSDAKTVWIHCASLGEFEQGRPIIEAIRNNQPDHKILLTFFSPSGYEVRKNYPQVDYVCYLPADTPRNVRRFAEIVKPEIAIFIKYEFWLNYINTLSQRGCRLFVVSAIFHPESVFFRWYGGIFRSALSQFERIFVQNNNSRKLLRRIKITQCEVVGDTRFDRVATIASAAKEIPVITKFVGNSRVFVAGSTWPADEDIIEQMIAKRTDLKFIIAPHEIDATRIDAMIKRLSCKSVRYTQCDPNSDVEGARVMFVDTIGILSSIYKYGYVGYIGGGFGVGIHNTLEAAAYGLPLAFGPNFRKFDEARRLVDMGAAVSIESFEQVDSWLTELTAHQGLYDKIHAKTKEFVNKNQGATQKIVKILFD